MASLYEHIREQRLPKPLPDEPADDAAPLGGPRIRWAAGARDGVAVFHISGKAPGIRQVAPMVDALLAFLRAPGQKEREVVESVVERLVADHPFVPFVGPILDRLEGMLDDHDHSIAVSGLPAASRRLVMETERRDTLKLGIALLGAFGGEEDRELLETVGLHDEFTLYAVDALAAIFPDPVDSWLLFAKKLTGWGKIHAVLALIDRLPEAGARRAEIEHFLLRHGCENGVLHGYLALPIATAAGLAAALEAKNGELDAELLGGAGVILSSLAEDAAQGGPTGDLGDYADGAVACERFLQAVVSSAPVRHAAGPGRDDFDAFLAAASIRAFVKDCVQTDYPRWSDLGWTAELCARLTGLADEFLAQPRWRDLALDTLSRGDMGERWKARAVCRVLDVPMAMELEIVVGADPSDVGAWQDLAMEADREGMERAAEIAPSLLRLEKLFVGGPSNSLGFGPDYGRFEICDAIASGLARFPGSGGALLRLLLQSPSVRNRHSALRAYEEWPQLGPDDRAAIAVVASGDPDGRVREHAEKIRLEKG